MESIRKIFEAIKKAGLKNNLLAFGIFILVLSSGSFVVNSLFTEGAGVIESSRDINYSEFMSLVAEEKIKTVTVSKTAIEATDDSGTEYSLHHDGWLFNTTILKDLSVAGVDVEIKVYHKSVIDHLIQGVYFLFYLFLFGFLVLMGFFILKTLSGGVDGEWPEVAKDNSVKFADVAGQKEAKYELEEIKDFLRNPESFERTGAKPPRGVLMVGPPGTGKTLLARALAGEAQVKFISVTGSDFSAMFVGVGRNKVEKLFKKARKLAPCIVFIDEIDSVARKRGGSNTDVSREQDTTLNQLLTEMNGFKPRDGVVVIGATNRLDVLDPALIRPGRFDRHVHINNSDMDGRVEILNVHVRGKPIGDDVDLKVVARGTPGFSGADLENLVNEAAILAAREMADSITSAHFEEARDKVLMGLQRKSMVLDEHETNLIAVHEAGHAVIACLTPHSDPVHQATIIPRGRSLGLVMRLPERDRISVPKSKLLADLDVAMAGRAAEEIVFGAEYVTTGASADIEMATNLARRMVCEWGMSPEIGMVRSVAEDGKTSSFVDKEVRKLIDEAYARAKTRLETNRVKLDHVVEALLTHKTLDGEEVRKLVNA